MFFSHIANSNFMMWLQLFDTLTAEKNDRQADIAKWENASKSGPNITANLLTKQNQVQILRRKR